MNERIKQLEMQVARSFDPLKDWDCSEQEYAAEFNRRFAELIVKECKENFTKVWYEQGLDIRGAELGKFLTRFEEHFGVEE
jgi:hypothetical protein